MRRFKNLIVLLCCFLLTGGMMDCSSSEDPYRVDTVVRIPVDPTEAPTELPDTAPAETEPEQTAPTETEPAATESAGKTTTSTKSSGSSSKSSGSSSKSSSSKSSTKSSSGTSTKSTEPEVTETPATEEPVMQADETQPEEITETEPPETTEPEVQLYDISGYSVGGLEYAMLDCINAYRTEAGLTELSLSSRLCAIASARAYEISLSWSHTRPDGRWFGTVLSDYGYGAGSVTENLAYSTAPSAQDIVDKWMSSDSTMQNILGSCTTAGIGVYSSGGVTYMACLLVG